MSREKPRVAFIDGNVNINFLGEISKPNISIDGLMTVSGDVVIPAESFVSDSLSHAFLCAKLFASYNHYDCSLFFLNIWEKDQDKASIDALVIALNWCLENDIKLINLSVGSTLLVDMHKLSGIVGSLVAKNVIIVASSSNGDELTFPAALDGVISVRAIEARKKIREYVYDVCSIDRIKGKVFLQAEFLECNDAHYAWGCSNSLAAPIMTAQICGFLSEGATTLKEVEKKLIKQSCKRVMKYNEIYRKHFKEIVKVPTLVFINDDSDFSTLIQSFLLDFSKKEYMGICLSEKAKTNITEQIINLSDFPKYSSKAKIRFYANYCNVDYVILEISSLKFSQLNSKYVDVLLYNPRKNYIVEENKYCVRYIYDDSSHKDLFEDIFQLLSTA